MLTEGRTDMTKIIVAFRNFAKSVLKTVQGLKEMWREVLCIYKVVQI
jgi:hypothetical protein